MTFNLRAVLTVTDNSGTKETEDRNQQVARAAGAVGPADCGSRGRVDAGQIAYTTVVGCGDSLSGS